ncbi:hypothetical protein ACFFRR_005717 [Megaselia abdita]
MERKKKKRSLGKRHERRLRQASRQFYASSSDDSDLLASSELACNSEILKVHDFPNVVTAKLQNEAQMEDVNSQTFEQEELVSIFPSSEPDNIFIQSLKIQNLTETWILPRIW